MTDLVKRLREALEDQTTSNDLYWSAEHGTPIPDQTIKRIIKDAAYPPLVDRDAVIRECAAVADRIVRDVAELPDRTSPDDWPEAMLVTADELRLIVNQSILELIEGDG